MPNAQKRLSEKRDASSHPSNMKDHQDEESVYLQEEGMATKKDDMAMTVKQSPRETDEVDDFDEETSNAETIGSTSVMLAEDTKKEDPDGLYYASSNGIAPTAHFYDDDDVMTMSSLASVFAEKKNPFNGNHIHNKRNSSQMATPSMGVDGSTTSYRTIKSSNKMGAAARNTITLDNDDDEHTIGNLSGIIRRVNLMENSDQKRGASMQKDEETANGTMIKYPLHVDSTDDDTHPSSTCEVKSRIPRPRKLAFCASITALMTLTVVGIIMGVFKLSSKNGQGPTPATPSVQSDDHPTAPSTTSPTLDYGSVSSFPTINPTVSPTASPSVSPTISYIGPLAEFLSENQVFVPVDQPNDPSFLAVQWLSQEANDLETPLQYNRGLVQRFSLLTIDFALQRRSTVQYPQTEFEMQVNNTETIFGSKLRVHSEVAFQTPHSTIAIQGVNECEWEGIYCDNVTDAVEEIRFPYQGLMGSIPSEIHLLRNSLKVVDLAGNNLQGSIPDGLYALTLLEELFLYQNNLTGTLSSKIGNWNNMTRLHLSHNQLSGKIPTELKSPEISRPLKYLNLYSNQFTGTIPESLRLRKLAYLDLGRNNLHGPLPSDLGRTFVELRYLHLDHNDFNGTIPESYMTVGNGRLEELSLNHNQLTGWVPDNFNTWDRMMAMRLHNNTFDGLGKEVCNLGLFGGSGQMIEFSADCDICDCTSYCGRCHDGDERN